MWKHWFQHQSCWLVAKGVYVIWKEGGGGAAGGGGGGRNHMFGPHDNDIFYFTCFFRLYNDSMSQRMFTKTKYMVSKKSNFRL